MKLSVVVSAESFRDRKNEVVIISPKKAYNICKLLPIGDTLCTTHVNLMWCYRR